MKTCLLLALLGLAVFSIPSESKAAPDSKGELYTLLDQKNAEPSSNGGLFRQQH